METIYAFGPEDDEEGSNNGDSDFDVTNEPEFDYIEEGVDPDDIEHK